MNIKLSDSFHRCIIFSPNLLTKKFRYKDIFQILPPNKNWYKTDFVQRAYPLVVEFDSAFFRPYKYEEELKRNKQYDRFIDSEFEFDTKSFSFKTEIMYLLTVFSFCFFREEKLIGSHNRQWYGKKYFLDTFQKRNISSISTKSVFNCFDENKLMGYEIAFPDIINFLLDSYFAFTDDKLDSLRKAIILFYKSYELESVSSSMSLVAMISAIETIVRYVNKDFKIDVCKECGNKKYRVSKQYRDFLLKYSGEIDRTKKKKYIDDIYSLRSNIVHSGYLFFSDYSLNTLDHLFDKPVNRIRYFLCHCLMNWIIEERSRTTAST